MKLDKSKHKRIYLWYHGYYSGKYETEDTILTKIKDFSYYLFAVIFMGLMELYIYLRDKWVSFRCKGLFKK